MMMVTWMRQGGWQMVIVMSGRTGQHDKGGTRSGCPLWHTVDSAWTGGANDGVLIVEHMGEGMMDAPCVCEL